MDTTTAPAFDWNVILNTVLGWLTSTGLKIVIALVLLFISFKLINLIARRIEKKASAKNADKTILKTLVYILKLGLKIVVLICLVGYLGIDTSGLTALVASLGVCAGLAVNGALSNLAGGVLIILTRPFKIDDYIEAQGQAGTVAEIRITMTKLITPDNKVIYLPNGNLANGDIVNYSECDTRRLEFKLAVAQGSDTEKIKELIKSAVEANELTLKDPAVFIRVTENTASKIVITVRAWVKNSDYWTVNFDLTEEFKRIFDANGISVPADKLDVNVKNS